MRRILQSATSPEECRLVVDMFLAKNGFPLKDAPVPAAAAAPEKVEDALALADSWRLVSACRNAIMLHKAKASDELPRLPKDLIAVARLAGHPDSISSDEFLDDYSRVTRRARQVAERLFYGE